MTQEPEVIEQKEAERLQLNVNSKQRYFIRGGLTYFRFSNGKETRITNISPLLGNKLAEKYPEPEIPLIDLPRADGNGIYQEPNPNDAKYQLDLAAYREKIETLSRRMIFNLAVIPFMELTDIDRREVKAYRDFMRDLDGVELEESDEYCYLAYCCIKGSDDYNFLTEAVMNRTRPTEAAIVRAIAEIFPADVQRSAAG